MRNKRDIIERLREDVAEYESLCGAAAIMAPNVGAELEDAIEEIESLRARAKKAEAEVVAWRMAAEILAKGDGWDE